MKVERTALGRCDGARLFACLVMPMAAAGCVTLDVKPTSKAQGVAGRQGVEYRLPFTQVKGVLVRRLAKCGAKPVVAIAFSDVAFKSAPDWTQRYVIDVQSLSSPMKTSALKIERYPNGQLKSINSEVEDRSAAVIVSVASTALQFLTPLKIPGGADEKTEGCTTEGVAALTEVNRLKAVAARDTEALAEATKILNGLLERVTLAGGQSDRGLRAAIDAAVVQVQKLQLTATSGKTALEEALEKITQREEFVWPELPTELGPKPMPVSDELTQAWFTPGYLETMRQSACVQFWLEPDRPRVADDTDSKVDAALEGVRYRESEPGAFVARLAQDELPQPGKPLDTCGKKPAKETYRLSGEVFQFGRLMSLPFRNRMFQSNSISATWDENGRLTSVSYGEKTAAAETAAKMLSDLMTAGRETLGTRRGEELADITRRNALLEAKLKQAELEGKLAPKVDPNVEKIANFDADRRVAEAETAAINAQIALAAARASQ
ncbi:hypothetical protein [Sphingomonas aquatilis]